MKIEKKCITCGANFLTEKCWSHRVVRCSKKCKYISRRGAGIEYNGVWYYLNKMTGYYYNSSLKILLHREIWRQFHGLPPRGFDVHHKNGIKTDNRIENLQLIEHGEHASQHNFERWRLRHGMVK